MSKPTLTIHTATYNRAHTLPAVYQSLCNQTCYAFDWFVTDNGSTDGTEMLFRKWCAEEKRFKIHYHKIKERGIPRALNYGINHISGDYFFMLDSDDKLLPEAVEIILRAIAEIDDIPEICAAGFVRITERGTPIKGVWPKVNENGYVDCTNLERWKYDLDADMCEAYKVEVIKQFPFQVWKDEIYAPEQLCFDAMAMAGYKVRWHKDAVYVCEYLEDGQTQGNWNLFRQNKMGYAMLNNQRLLYVKSFKERFKSAGQHIALSIVAGYPSYILRSNKKLLTLIALPYGIALSFRRREQFKWDDPINRRNNK
jgi:glycosyltransferase involved in cell wall biosynthesis